MNLVSFSAYLVDFRSMSPKHARAACPARARDGTDPTPMRKNFVGKANPMHEPCVVFYVFSDF